MNKALNEIPGTVSYVLKQRQDELDFTSLQSLKASTIKILQSEDIKQKEAAQSYIYHVQKMTSFNKLLSTIGTYLSGLKAVSSYPKKNTK